jgi:D-alanyl-D-alanine carboxypeptidase
MTATLSYEQQVAEILLELGIKKTHKKRKPFREATELVSIGRDIYEREQKLAPNAATAWYEMKSAAENDRIVLLIVSAFRSVVYQKQIIQRKLAAGQKVEQILRVSAAPSYSEHHTGRAIDVTTYNCKPLTEEFERTLAFVWLNRRANDFGFVMSYPRDNQLGVIYEPWHWTFRSSD